MTAREARGPSLFGWSCLMVAAAACVSISLPVQGRVRYHCTFIDGSVRVLMQNVALDAKEAVRSCEAVSTAPPRVPRTEEGGPQAVPAPPKVMLIRAAPAVRRTAPAVAAARGSYDALIAAASLRHDVDAQLIRAVIHVESRHNPNARSHKGALGLMQVMPDTGARYGVDDPARLLDAATNIDIGTRYLSDLLRMFEGRRDLVLAAYNAGEGNVIRYGNRIPPFPETRLYVRDVLANYEDGAKADEDDAAGAE